MSRWLNPENVDTSALDNLGLSQLVAQTLIRRGFTSPAEAQIFLDPSRFKLQSPLSLPGLDKASDRIIDAIESRKSICIWGDFDVDGQTATTILVQTLQSLGANVYYHIPIRAKESHGLNLENLIPVINKGVELIITCDTGISAVEEAEYARVKGVQYIITDHHDLPDKLPIATSIVNPKFLPPDHPSANLPGAGVAYKLAEALIVKMGAGTQTTNTSRVLTPDSLLDLAVLGIIADLAMLKGETRALAQTGLEILRKTDRLGLQTIAKLANLDLSQATEESIGFNLAPRLNALGRLSDANPAVELFLTKDPDRARALAAQIEGLNTQRKLLTEQVYQAAEAQLRADPSLLTQPLLLLTHPSWPGGVIGIVASRLVERYQKATILMTGSDNGKLHGSARSVEGLNITEAIAANKNFLIAYGGHPMAAGLSLLPENLQDFYKAVNRTAGRMLKDIQSEEPTVRVDAWVELSSLSLDLVNSFEGLAPFGPGNPALVFATHGLHLESENRIGKTEIHRKLMVADDKNKKQEVIWWNSGSEDLPESLNNPGNKFDLAYRLRAATYRGNRQLSVEFLDYRITEQKPIEIHKSKLEIIDLRQQPLITNLSPSMLIWAEGNEKLKGKSRFELYQADKFAIWTIPPSPFELRNALEIVKPKTVYLFAVNPAGDPTTNRSRNLTEEFLRHLSGLAKFAINNRAGAIDISQLAASTGDREGAILLGLEWLAAGGHLSLKGEDKKYQLGNGDGITKPYLQSELLKGVKALLEETEAYRIHFSRAEAQSIFKF